MSNQRHNYSNLGHYFVPDCIKGGICVDIGGNTGCFSLKYATFFKTIHTYEPQSECFEIIKNRIKEYTNISLFREAVFSESNKIVELISHANHDSGSVGLKSECLNNDWKSSDVVDSNVRTVSLDDVLLRIGGYIDYMKIDCETSEYNFLMNKDLSKINYLGIELHWQMGKQKWDELIQHILTYFTLYSHSDLSHTYETNKEVLFISKTLHTP